MAYQRLKGGRFQDCIGIWRFAVATKEEMRVLNWFLSRNPGLFTDATAKAGTDVEDWAGIDAWLEMDGKPAVSVGVRRHADEPGMRHVSVRIRQGEKDRDRFELAKLSKGGGPQFYLQAWGDNPDTLSEYVFVSMSMLKATNCFQPDNFTAFWEEHLFVRSQTLWANMPVEKLVTLNNCVILADVYDRGLIAKDEAFDCEITGKPPRKHFLVPPSGDLK